MVRPFDRVWQALIWQPFLFQRDSLAPAAPLSRQFGGSCRGLGSQLMQVLHEMTALAAPLTVDARQSLILLMISWC